MRRSPRIPNRNKGVLARKTASTADLPAPIGGLNTRDSLSMMPVTDAISLVNWLPQANGLTSRKGLTERTTGYSATPETVLSYKYGSNRKLITASDDDLYTDNGAGTLTSLGTGFGNARWDAVQLGQNMVLVNGADAPRNYDGSSLTTPTFGGDLNTYGADNIDGIHKHKNRVYMWDTEYPNFFYGGVNSVSGSFAEFNLDRVSDTSGNLIEMKTISRDAGDGPDDYAAFILDTGEVLIYQGSDPGTANNWALVGKYQIPPIIAKNCAIEFSGDVLILTNQDIVKLSEVIKFGGEEGGFNIKPSKLSGAIATDYAIYGSNYGWQLTTYPSEGWIIINVPVATNTEYHQYVINTTTGASTKLEGWNAAQFGKLNDALYFGNNTSLFQAQEGDDDDGADIALVARPAFSNLGTAARKKVSNARLYVESEGSLDVDMEIGYDYNFPNFQGTQTSQVTGALWDVASWDVAEWSGTQARLIDFVTSGLGVYVSPQIRTQISGQQVKWYSTTYNFNVAENY